MTLTEILRSGYLAYYGIVVTHPKWLAERGCALWIKTDPGCHDQTIKQIYLEDRASPNFLSQEMRSTTYCPTMRDLTREDWVVYIPFGTKLKW